MEQDCIYTKNMQPAESKFTIQKTVSWSRSHVLPPPHTQQYNLCAEGSHVCAEEGETGNKAILCITVSLSHTLEVSVINDPPEITGESRILSKVLLHCLPTALNKLVHFPRWAENIVRGNTGLSRIQALAPDYALGGHHYVGVFDNDGWAVGMVKKKETRSLLKQETNS